MKDVHIILVLAKDAEPIRSALDTQGAKHVEIVSAQDISEAVELSYERKVDMAIVWMPYPDNEAAVKRLTASRAFLPVVCIAEKQHVGALLMSGAVEIMEEVYLSEHLVTVAQRGLHRMRHASSTIWRASHDSLTLLPNRQTFVEAVETALIRHRRGAAGFAVILIDIDRFKPINDNFGHHVGDEALRVIAQRLTASVRESDVVSRRGGDEFAVLVTDVHARDEVAPLAQRICDSLSMPMKLFDRIPATVGCSLGITMVLFGEPQVDAVLEAADTAQRQAKMNGGNRYIFSESTDRYTVLSNELAHALDRDELKIAYQPQCEFLTSSVVGYEALLRWPTRPDVSPEVFCSNMERTSEICRVGAWVLLEALRATPGTEVSVNVAPVQMDKPWFARMVQSALQITGRKPSDLNLEVVERSVLQLSPNVSLNTEKLVAMGCRFSLDDLASGAASLTGLLLKPTSEFKIDRIFTQAIDSTEPGERSKYIVQALADLAFAVKARVVAEGIERESQAVAVALCGCQRGQGYYFGHPSIRPAQPFDSQWFATVTQSREGDMR